jgi:hypothetical protein
MRRVLYLVLALALAVLAFPLSAAADHGNADEASPNMFHVANLPQPPQFLACDRGSTSCFNSDLAFWEAGAARGRHHRLAAQGNYEGFRLVDIRDPENPVQVSVVECRSNQGDLSFYQADNRLLLIQSVEEPTTTDECSTAVETGIAPGTHPITGLPGQFRVPGFEGLRIFDVSNPEAPVFIKGVPTACGSHTHTTIPDQRNQRALVYVSSYPTGARLTPAEGLDFGGPTCVPPHAKFSIVEILDRNPAAARVLKEQPLHGDTAPFRGTLGSGGTGAIGCHDITAFYETQSVPRAGQSFRHGQGRQVAGGACLEEGQLWDISDPANPTTLTTHSHLRNPFITSQVGLWHTASFTWDGQIVLFTDEWMGGGAHGCDGPQDTRGNVWFYKNVPPGTEPVPLFGRFITPRPQPAEDACSMHNGNVVPTNDAYLGVSSAYEGGTSVFDFSGVLSFPPITDLDVHHGQPVTDLPVPPTVAREVAFYDARADGRGFDDAWSTYWHNDYLYASSGLQRPGQRGLDVYKILLPKGEQTPDVTDTPSADDRQFRARKFRYQNPQTQDTFQCVGCGR